MMFSPAKPEHARGIAEVHVQSWRTTYKNIVAAATLASLDTETRAEQWFARLSGPQSKTCTFVAEDEHEQVVGFAMAGPTRSEDLKADAELYAIYLYEHSQRKGIGATLLHHVVRFLIAEDFSSVGVWVLELNPSRGFYEVLGAQLIASKSISRDGLDLRELGYCWPSIDGLVQRLAQYVL